MKKLISLSVLMLLIYSANAQTQFGLFAGPQSTWAKYTLKGEKQETSNKVGFQLGGAFKVPFEERLFFAPAAFYSMKGYKVDLQKRAFPPDTSAVDNNTTIHTFELAFLLQYELGKKEQHFFIKAGQSLDFQLSGKEEYHKKDGSLVSQDMKFAFDAYVRVGANAVIQFGYEMKKGYFIYGQYSHGIGGIANADKGPRIFHRVAGITIGKYLTTLGRGQ